MKERPIIMRGEEVRAILEGRKSQTRRVCKRIEGNNVVEFRQIEDGRFEIFEDRYGDGKISSVRIAYRCPYGVPGDRLWVLESYWIDKTTGEFKWYVHHGLIDVDRDRDNVRLRPAIHMPRSMSRLTLEIKAVRVERLQEISEEDARAEGVIPLQMDHGLYRPSFEGLWDSINAKRGYGWDANPWVWCIAFRRLDNGVA